MTKVFTSSNPSSLYLKALNVLLTEGDECAPRGRKIKEIRPAIFEYTNPANRVTFLKGRVINPFFQLAEALWIVSGRSDVKWLTDYNKSIGQFSDDGEYFNAPYGERLRYWNKSDANHFIFNPIDQLYDVYKKIKADKDTRQAVAVIYNPLFDNIENNTLDRPCNMILTFKLRNNKLDLNVFNRSNDIHWGTFGANLCQFSTLLEVMANWLEVDMGTYYQTTDSLHVYLEDYGAKETEKILSNYKGLDLVKYYPTKKDMKQLNELHTFKDEPRMSSNLTEFNEIMSSYFSIIDPAIRNKYLYSDSKSLDTILQSIKACPDRYWRLTFTAMASYQAHKAGAFESMCKLLKSMEDSSWKISCLRFLSKRYKHYKEFQVLYSHLSSDIQKYIERREENICQKPLF